jgi:mannose-6-phosphate isomerase
MGASESQEERARYRAQAFAATKSVWGYLQTPLPGLWWDRMMPDGKFMEEPAPASSFYHIICAIKSLRDSFSAEQPAGHFNSKATA